MRQSFSFSDFGQNANAIEQKYFLIMKMRLLWKTSLSMCLFFSKNKGWNESDQNHHTSGSCICRWHRRDRALLQVCGNLLPRYHVYKRSGY